MFAEADISALVAVAADSTHGDADPAAPPRVAGLGVFGFVPVIHQSFFTWADMPTPVRIAIAYMLVMGACYLTVSCESGSASCSSSSPSDSIFFNSQSPGLPLRS